MVTQEVRPCWMHGPGLSWLGLVYRLVVIELYVGVRGGGNGDRCSSGGGGGGIVVVKE